MEHITVENIDKELSRLLECSPMSYCSLEKLVLLCRSRKYLCSMHQDLTDEDARAWMANLNPPPRWTMDQTTTVMGQRGYCHRPCEFWAVMNALFSDYGKTLAKHGADKPEVWADLAHDFICDADAEKDKVGKYYRHITKHE